MTVTQRQKDILKGRGFNFIEEIAKAADEGDIHLYILVAMLEKETATVRNVYGGDSGGALRGYKGEVNEGSYAVFRWMVDVGVPIKQYGGGHKIVKFGPNGIGPSQITHPDLLEEMLKAGLDVRLPADNILFGGKKIYGYYRSARNNGKSVSAALKYAGTRYNGDPDYGDAYLEVATRWRGWLGNEDYRPT